MSFAITIVSALLGLNLQGAIELAEPLSHAAKADSRPAGFEQFPLLWFWNSLAVILHFNCYPVVLAMQGDRSCIAPRMTVNMVKHS